jgi:hypothetical protein
MSQSSPIHSSQIDAFISFNPTEILVKRRKRTSDGAGGWVLSDLSSPDTKTYGPITGRRISSYRLRAMSTVVTADGRTVVPEFAFIFVPNSNVKLFDIFVVNGEHYEVVSLSDAPSWRLSAEAVRADN